MNEQSAASPSLSDRDISALRPLGRQFPNLDAALAEIARLSAELALPKGTIHVISDVHGDNVKLRHVINNASGTLRPLVQRLFGDRLGPAEFQEFLTLIFYPKETLAQLEPILRDLGVREAFCERTLRQLFELVRVLARRYTLQHAIARFPTDYRDLLRELLAEPSVERSPEYIRAVIDALVRHERALHVIRLVVRVVRNLAVDELIIAGDCWDRGARGDLVVDYLMRQPNVAFTWGNHDAAWLGACLGHEALIAHVLRISCRYRRLTQLEEGYGITLQPLEHLVRSAYGDDPATAYTPKGAGLREAVTVARMQKAAAVLQFKLEGQVIDRNPDWQLDHRRLLHRMDLRAGTITIDGTTFPLKDTHFPTLDPASPYQLSRDEQQCLDRIRQSFLSSQKLWQHMRFLAERGSMYLRRDDGLIFHGCLPVDEKGEWLPLTVDGRSRRGKELFDAFDQVLARVLYKRQAQDLDWLWYLWCGPRSPLFGKDRIATLENDLVADKKTHVETKNPYFQLIHDPAFCDRVLKEFDVDPQRGLIVNGHVPVKIEQGESPLKRSGKAITIDGAFSQAYGDHGYTLVLEADRTLLAKHHHFDSVEAAVRDGVDIIPEITVIRESSSVRRTADTERGDEMHREIALLERLVSAYRENKLRQPY